MSDEGKTREAVGPQEAQVLRLAVGVGAASSLQKFARNGGLEAAPGAVGSNAYEVEDEFASFYLSAMRDSGILEPPYPLRTLDRLCQENNALGPCIEAMVTNIDGTGSRFKQADLAAGNAEDQSQIARLEAFFAQPWPGKSFIEMRKELRRDQERIGNAYLEVLRNPQDEIVFLRPVDAKMIRLVKLDAAVPVEVSLQRDGRLVSVTVMKRERRFAQLLNGITLVYFKEFGSRRDLNKNTGQWAAKNQRLPANLRATEILHFSCIPDSHSPYGLPRWIGQLPSVLGSRKAEEFNLEFFDNGGVPPALIVLQGGTLQSETRKALESKFAGGATRMNRVQILEVEPTGGSLDKPTTARVTVERFGGDRSNDSMFELYDDKCETRIRRAFRLPPLFMGQANDYAFSTAYVSYTTAEAQVFKPERQEFDAMVSMRLLPALGFEGYRMVSTGLTIEDMNLKMKAIELFKDSPLVSDDDIIDELNQMTGLHFKLVPEEDRPAPPPAPGAAGTHDKAVVGDRSPRQQEIETTARDATPNPPRERNRSRKNDGNGVAETA